MFISNLFGASFFDSGNNAKEIDKILNQNVPMFSLRFLLMKDVERLADKLTFYFIWPLKKSILLERIACRLMYVCFLVLICILSACNIPWSSGTSSNSYQFKFTPAQPSKAILVCNDRTGSVNASIYDAGLRLVMRNLAKIIHTGQGSITFTLAKIDHHSHIPESTLVTGQIAAVKTLPQEPILSPFLDLVVKKQIMDEYAYLKDDSEKSLQQSQAQATQLETAIMRHDSRHVPVDKVGTDILGCLLKANDLFTKDPSIRHYLLVVSDLVQNIDVSRGVSLLLPNVKASIVFYCSDPAKICQNRKLAYQSLLTEAGAQVTFYDVSQIDLVNGIFGG